MQHYHYVVIFSCTGPTPELPVFKTKGEAFNVAYNTWKMIPGIIKGFKVKCKEAYTLDEICQAVGFTTSNEMANGSF